MVPVRSWPGLAVLTLAVLVTGSVRAQKAAPGEAPKDLSKLTAKDFRDAIEIRIATEKGKDKDEQSRTYQEAQKWFVLDVATIAAIQYDPATGTLRWKCPLQPGAKVARMQAEKVLEDFVLSAVAGPGGPVPAGAKASFKVRVEAFSEAPEPRPVPVPVPGVPMPRPVPAPQADVTPLLERLNEMERQLRQLERLQGEVDRLNRRLGEMEARPPAAAGGSSGGSSSGSGQGTTPTPVYSYYSYPCYWAPYWGYPTCYGMYPVIGYGYSYPWGYPWASYYPAGYYNPFATLYPAYYPSFGFGFGAGFGFVAQADTEPPLPSRPARALPAQRVPAGDHLVLATHDRGPRHTLMDLASRGPEDAEPLFWRGYRHFWQGRYADALEELEAATQLGQDARFWYYRGLTERALGHERAAVASIRRGAALRRQNLPGVDQIGQALERVQGADRRFLNAAARDAK